jgi:hypothetical protein
VPAVIGGPVGGLVPIADKLGVDVQQDRGFEFAGVHVLVV